MTDPALERLARANPEVEPTPGAPDRERDALLARLLAEPVDAPAPVPPPRRRLALPRPRLTIPMAAAALVVAVVLTAAGVLSSRDGLADRAYAAVTGPNAILHVVWTLRVEGEPDLLGGADGRRTMVSDSRYDLRSARYRALRYEVTGGRRTLRSDVAGDGRTVTGRIAGLPGRQTEPQRGRPDDDPLAAFKAAYRSGTILSERETTWRGVPAFEVRVDATQGARGSTTEIVYVFDRATDLPLAQRGRTDYRFDDGRTGTARFRVTYDTTEYLPRTRAELAKLRYGAPRP